MLAFRCFRRGTVLRSSLRMSTLAEGSPVRQRFFVYAPDKTAEGTFEQRLSVRSIHLENVKERIAKGTVRVGGVLLTPESIATPAADKKMVGSTFICEAETIDEVKTLIQDDIYYTAGVWDTEKIVILPFIAATAIP